MTKNVALSDIWKCDCANERSFCNYCAMIEAEKLLTRENKMSIKLVVLSAITGLFMSACGTHTVDQQQIPGPVGQSGLNGSNGKNGLNSLMTSVSASLSACPSGGVTLLSGLDTNGDGLLSASEVTASSTVCNGLAGATGATGAAGQNGTNATLGAFTPVTFIAPCTNASSPYKEQLICLNNGEVYSSFSDTAAGSETRFAFLTAGSFVDTDDSGCNFSVSIDTSGNTTVSWGAGSNQYATWVAGSSKCVAN